MVTIASKRLQSSSFLSSAVSGGGAGGFRIAMLSHLLFGMFCFYIGVVVSLGSFCEDKCPVVDCSKKPICPACPEITNNNNADEDGAEKDPAGTIFPSTLSKVVVGHTTVKRESITDLLNIGVPLDETKRGAEDALVLYNDKKSVPTSPTNDVASALENCTTVRVILYQPGARRQCMAIIPQWESYYLHKFMRIPPKGERPGQSDTEYPLRYVSRGTKENRGVSLPESPDLNRETYPFYAELKNYLENLPRLLKDLNKILQPFQNGLLAGGKRKQTVLVQVCNYGQVELFHNFICTAKARGIEVTPAIMFATDEATLELCQKLGIPAFYDDAIFKDLPESAARGYGDAIFSRMMMAKVYCVHLVLSSGFNVLFQDVDVVWYKNPLPYFDNPELDEWDMMFQDDGSRQDRYAPYSPNTGFYFVRHSPETLFFFGMLLRMGDVIFKMGSHQAALTALLNEHASWKGLRVKVWPKGDGNQFPGGFEFHRKKEFMKQLVQRKIKEEESPYLFHMSWTHNKDNKKKFFQQMGEWHVKENCLTGFECCLAKPQITCHYRDKASIIPCKDSPPIDNGRPSFW